MCNRFRHKNKTKVSLKLKPSMKAYLNTLINLSKNNKQLTNKYEPNNIPWSSKPLGNDFTIKRNILFCS